MVAGWAWTVNRSRRLQVRGGITLPKIWVGIFRWFRWRSLTVFQVCDWAAGMGEEHQEKDSAFFLPPVSK